MTAELSEENYVTISSIIPLIRGLQHIIKNVQIETKYTNRCSQLAIGEFRKE